LNEKVGGVALPKYSSNGARGTGLGGFGQELLNAEIAGEGR
jgi:hypothetical protein